MDYTLEDHRNPPKLRGIYYFLRCKLQKRPKLLNIEFTKHCNAKCSFCACWQVESPNEMTDYSAVVKKFRPLVVAVSGGEPLLRRHYDTLLKDLRPYCHFLQIITNGALLNENSAEKLVKAGVNQISVSLDYIGNRHSENRKIEGLYEHIEATLPKLAQKCYKIALNTVIMESNLDHIIPIAHKAKEWGIYVSYSAYCTLKKDLNEFMVRPGRFEELRRVVGEIKKLKRTLGNIRNSDFYLDNIPVYFQNGGIGNCHAGKLWMQVTPDGYVQQCSELPRVSHFTEYETTKVKKPACTKCWYACRGESEANPLAPRRLIELFSM
ncbi:MAG: radical SAM protein [Deltaproteobacteria bacterium]|nr:radical SAM protein [Deltaproteobacteria bacterium]